MSFPFKNLAQNIGLALVYGGLSYSLPYFGLSGIGLFFGALGLLPIFLANSFLIGFNLRIISAVEIGAAGNQNILDISQMLADIGETLALGSSVLLITVLPVLVSLKLATNSWIYVWLALGWMIFYYPLALVIAATTSSFWETINPLNGLREVLVHRRAYAKFFIFYLMICAVTGGLVITVLVKVLELVSGSPIFTLLPIFVALMIVLGSLVFFSNLALSYLAGRVRFKRAS